MCIQYDINCHEQQPPEEESQWWAQQVETYRWPYRERLDAYLDRRVVGKSFGHGGRDRANAHGVDEERLGKCDLWARAHRCRHATLAARTAP